MGWFVQRGNVGIFRHAFDLWQDPKLIHRASAYEHIEPHYFMFHTNSKITIFTYIIKITNITSTEKQITFVDVFCC